jgi:SPX domain protein involved in polyphosphate accumulation
MNEPNQEGNSESEYESARYEVKFTAPIDLGPFLHAWILSHPNAFRSAYPDRKVNNIYFDTQELEAFQENQAGVANRSKLRLRWYGNSFQPQYAQLERKRRCGKIGWKDITPIEFLSPLESLTWFQLYKVLQEQISGVFIAELSQSSFPSLYNSYHRKYFISANNKIRLTLDSKLCGYDQRISLSLNRKISCVYPSMLVVEIKGATAEREEIKRVLSSNPLPLSRCSKYAIGVQSMLYY